MAGFTDNSPFVTEQDPMAVKFGESPTETMLRRWKDIVEKTLPAIDLIDLSNEKEPIFSEKVQFAPEFSQSSYCEMLRQEFAIGDYICFNQVNKGVSEVARKHMITLMEDLNRIKDYKEETLYLAASIADRYLVNLAVKRIAAPCLIRLAIVSILMAAKLEQPIQPSFNRMVKLVSDQWDVKLTRQDLLDLEENIIRTLDFDLRSVSPLHFLHRFQRVLQQHKESQDY